MTESRKFAFLYYIQSHPDYENYYNKNFTGWSKIPLIKVYRAIFSTGLREAKEEIEELQGEYFIVNRVNITSPLGLREEIPGWTLSDKATEFIEDMLSIDEIKVEIIKYHLMSYGQSDYQSVYTMYTHIHDIWEK